MKRGVIHFLCSLTAVITLSAGIVLILATIALFFGAEDAPVFLLYAGPIFIIGALLLTFVIKDGWQRFFGEALSGIPWWPF